MGDYIQFDKANGRLMRVHGSFDDKLAQERDDLVKVSEGSDPELVRGVGIAIVGLLNNWGRWTVEAGKVRQKTQEELDAEAAAAAQTAVESEAANLEAGKSALAEQFTKRDIIVVRRLLEAAWTMDDRTRRGLAQVPLATVETQVKDAVLADIAELTKL